MNLYENMTAPGYERVVLCTNQSVGLTAIVSIHDTTFGPALGGTRMRPYHDRAEALFDVLRLSKAMTYKNAIAGLPFGGGKAVIIGDPATDKTAERLYAYGDFLNYLGGQYLTAEDVGMSVTDMDTIRRRSLFARGFAEQNGDPSPATAMGVYLGLQQAVQFRMGRSVGLCDISVAVQGLGSVGMKVCEYLHRDGAKLLVADINPAAVAQAIERFDATAVATDLIHAQRVDVFCPCALGAVLNSRTIGQIKASVVAGAANNQLAEGKHGEQLRDRDILYAPDYVINAGGVVDIAFEGAEHQAQKVRRKVGRIPAMLERIFQRARHSGQATNRIADALAEELLHHARGGAPHADAG